MREIVPLTPFVEFACSRLIPPGTACRIQNAPLDTKVFLDGKELPVYREPTMGGPYFVIPTDLAKGQHDLRVTAESSPVAAIHAKPMHADAALLHALSAQWLHLRSPTNGSADRPRRDLQSRNRVSGVLDVARHLTYAGFQGSSR